MTTTTSPFIIGWQEWLALPELGLPAIKAKTDTGARTSALHAFLIEPFGPAGAPMVRFGVHPIPGRLDVAVYCSAPIVDRREVMSSNGERETRYFIRTDVALGERTWPIEIGLTNREGMSYRMLLGRQAIRDDMMVDVATSFRQPRLSYKLYRGVPRHVPVRRPLRIALVAREPDAPFNRRLAETAAARGHVLELLALERLALSFDDDVPGLLCDGNALAHYDAVIPRLGRQEGPAGAAIVRQMELTGSVSLNPGDAIERVANRLAAAQALARDRLPQALAAETGDAALAAGKLRLLRVLVVDQEALAMTTITGERRQRASLARYRALQRLAEDAAGALGLGLAAVDISLNGERAEVVHVSARPALARLGKGSGGDIGERLIQALETRMNAQGKGVRVAE